MFISIPETMNITLEEMAIIFGDSNEEVVRLGNTHMMEEDKGEVSCKENAVAEE